MSLLHIVAAPIRAEHQLQARDLLQSTIRWPREELDFLRAVITRASLNAREARRPADLRQQGKAVAHG